MAHPFRIIPAALILTALAAIGCVDGLSEPSPADSDLEYCADEVNRLRASRGLSTLSRSAALEAFAAVAAAHDATARVAHQYFAQTNGAGVTRGETEILWWTGLTVRAVIRGGLAQMWDQGPGGDHYFILAGPYTEVGCGVFVNGQEVTVAQEFR